MCFEIITVVFDQPRLKSSSQDQIWARANTTKQLQCHFSAPTMPGVTIIVWKKDKIPLDNPDKYIIKNYVTPETNTVSSTLTIDSVSNKDGGTYSCYAILNKTMVTSKLFARSAMRHIYLHIGEEGA